MIIIDKILLKIIATFIRSLKLVYKNYSSDTVDIVYKKVDLLITGLIADILIKAPDIVEKDLKLLNKRLLNLPLKFDRNVIDNIVN